jgi:hypothetical protein
MVKQLVTNHLEEDALMGREVEGAGRRPKRPLASVRGPVAGGRCPDSSIRSTSCSAPQLKAAVSRVQPYDASEEGPDPPSAVCHRRLTPGKVDAHRSCMGPRLGDLFEYGDLFWHVREPIERRARHSNPYFARY